MANSNTKRKRAELARAFAAAHKTGQKITPPARINNAKNGQKNFDNYPKLWDKKKKKR